MKVLFFLLIPILVISCYKGEHADLIIHNAKIYSCDENFTIYEAMSIRDGKIIQLGPEREILNGYSYDQKIDAEMRPVFPGFHDAHCHFWNYAATFSEVDLIGASSFDEVVERIENFAHENEDNFWITGRGWDQTLWEDSKFPTNERLNELFPNRPIYVKRVDGHAALVNQKALDLAEINTETIIKGGHIEVHNGQLTGLLKDNACDLISAVIPELDPSIKLKYLQEAEYRLFEHGLTSINDAGISDLQRGQFIEWYDKKELSIKDYAMLFPDEGNMDFAGEQGIYIEGNLHIGSFKVVSDGAMGSRGACLIDPYTDRKDEHGFLLYDLTELEAICEFAKEIDYQVNSHCIGDSANRSLLQLYAKIIQDKIDHRWKIEHAQVVHPDDFSLFEEIRIVPSVQPTHCTSDMRWAEERLGSERIRFAYAYKKLLNLTGRIALGTDFPVENISPLETFYAAITRMDKTGSPKNGFYPDQVLTRKEAIKGMTIWPAWSNFEETNKGTLEVGKAADFVMLTKDIMEIPAAEILKTYVYLTYLDGNQVYAAE